MWRAHRKLAWDRRTVSLREPAGSKVTAERDQLSALMPHGAESLVCLSYRTLRLRS